MKKIGKYEILGELGKGAMGKVYRARDSVLGRIVALKTMLEGVDQDEELLKRFMIEAQAAAQLNHENIITVYDLGTDGDAYFIAMEFLDGDDLKAIMKKGELTLQEKLNIILQICSGLVYAHKKGVVHRDIKPANVMLLQTGKVKIMDFGIAHMASSDMTKTGMIIGTPDYMSPEQVVGKKIDSRSDIFSVGIIFFEMMTKRKPFSSESVTTILYKIAHEPIPTFDDLDIEVPIEIETIILKAVEKEPEKRYQTMQEMIKDLEAVISLYGAQKMPTQPALQNEIKKLVSEGKILMKSKKFQNAAEVYNKALSLDPDNSVLKRLIDKVETELLKTKKDDVDGILKQADKFLMENKFKEAIKMAESSFDILPDGTSAKILISKAQSISVEFERNKLLASQVNKVKGLIKKGNHADAIKEAKVLDDIDPNNKLSKKLIEDINALRDKAEDKKQISMILDHVEENIRIKNLPEAQKSMAAAVALDPKNKDVIAVKKKLDKMINQMPASDEKTLLVTSAQHLEEQATIVDMEFTPGMEDTASQPTVVATPTSSRAAVGASEFDEDTIAATQLGDMTKTVKKTVVAKVPHAKKSKAPLVAFVLIVIVAIVAGLYFSGTLTKQPGEQDVVDLPVRTDIPIAQGIVELNVVPWATIESILDESNNKVEIPASTAPCELVLPAGSYTLTLYNAELGKRENLKVQIEGGKSKSVNLKLMDWDAEYLMKELGIE